MTPEQYQRAVDLFHAALEFAPEARPAFLAQVSVEFRQEVESMLAADAKSGGFLDQPPDDLAASAMCPSEHMPAIGRRFLGYEVVSLLGAGGMCEVYRAWDSKLKREVAIKVLPVAFANDAGRMSRFQREAEALASLNHPNIATIYGLEEWNGRRALVMELVPGKTLDTHIKPGSLPVETALNYAKQIADAIEAAHEKGIIHRDLKPANIMVTPEGVVKVLDFGLAAVSQASTPGDGNPTNSPTLTSDPAKAGMIVGTAAYMSPEQASGKPVDKRSDIWSFGVVLFEMLTGQRLFHGETTSHTLAVVLNGPIDFSKLPRATPGPIRGLLRRCLERNVKNRLQAIGDGRIVISEVLQGSSQDEGPIAVPRRRTLVPWAAAAVGITAALVVSFVHFREKPLTRMAPVRFQILAPENVRLGALFNVSPDGRKLAFLAGGRLWVHFLESGETRDLTAASGSPFWSSDSHFIAYPSLGKLKTMDATGGPSQTVTEDYRGNWGGGAWNQDDVIVFSDVFVGLFRVPASGGVPVQITAVDPVRQETMHYSPRFLPDGRHFVYTRVSLDDKNSTICIGSVDLKPEQQSAKPLVNSTWKPVYTPSADSGTGYLLFVRKDTLMAQPFDNRRLELTGQATPVAEQISNDGRAFSASDNGVLVFQQRTVSDRITWYDQAGKVLGTLGDPGDYQELVLSPDGTRLAVSKRTGHASNIWMLDLSRDTNTPLTYGSTVDGDPVWSPDARRIIFTSSRDGSFNLYQKPTNGEKDEEILLKSSEEKHPTSWSRDGRFLLFTAVDPKTKSDIWVLPLEGDHKPVPFLITEFNEENAQFSPDSRWVAYESDESGRREVYVRSFSMNSARTVVEASGKWPISSGAGTDPARRRDGQELYYRSSPDGKIMSVEIMNGPVFRAGKPRPLGLVVSGDAAWDSTADGKRFLVTTSNSTKPEPYTVVLNWQAGLKK